MIERIQILNGKRDTLQMQLKRNATLNLFTPEQLAETIADLVSTEKEITRIYTKDPARQLFILYAVIAVVGVIIGIIY